ncbi:MAG: hypothetical protein WC520_03970 [Candidatus Paceibacterota bacterium]
MKFFPAITTITKANWRDKVDEVDRLGLEEVALFPTCLNAEQRKDLYTAIEHTSIKHVPFIHLRSDMELWELDHFVKKYDTQIFNVHSAREYPINKDWLKYKQIICIENTQRSPLDPEEIKNFGGICLDFSHLENDRLVDKDKFAADTKCLASFPVRCNHISAIKTKFSLDENEKLHYDSHMLKKQSELDYLKRYPLEYFSDFCAMELENKISDQLIAIDYINELIKNRDDFIKSMGF